MSDIPELDKVRTDISSLDRDIVDSLAKRDRLIRRVVVIKQAHDLEPYQPDRFAQMMKDLREYGASVGADPQLIDDIWDVIHHHGVALQEDLTPKADN